MDRSHPTPHIIRGGQVKISLSLALPLSFIPLSHSFSLSRTITRRLSYSHSILLHRAIKLLGNLVAEKGQRLQPSVPTMDDQVNWLHLGYYSSQLLHLFQHEAIIACALAKCGHGNLNAFDEGVPMEELMDNIQFLDNMLKFEFIPADHNVHFLTPPICVCVCMCVFVCVFV